MRLETDLETAESFQSNLYLASLAPGDAANVRHAIEAVNDVAELHFALHNPLGSRERGIVKSHFESHYTPGGREGHPFCNLYAIGSSLRTAEHKDIDLLMATNFWYLGSSIEGIIEDLDIDIGLPNNFAEISHSPLESCLLAYLNPHFRVEKHDEIPDHYGMGLGTGPKALWTLQPDKEKKVDFLIVRCLKDAGNIHDIHHQGVGDEYFCADEQEFLARDTEPSTLLYRSRMVDSPLTVI